MKKTLLILSLLFFVANVYAQDEVTLEESPEASLPPESTPVATPAPVEDDLEFKTGILSSTGTVKKSGAVDMPSVDGSPGEEQAAVSGSVSNAKGSCSAKVSNDSELSSYSVTYEVQGLNDGGTVVFRKAFSARLSPGQTVERDFSCREGLAMSLVLKSGRKLE